MSKLSRTVCAVLLTLLQACASSFDRVKSHTSRSVSVLEHQQDADSLAAAALLTSSDLFGKDPKRASSLIARATAAAPDRADLAWLRARICEEAPPCDAQPFDLRVRALDPSNGAVWLGALARSWDAKDDAGTNEALSAIGQTDRVDVYYTGLVAKLTPKIAQAGSISVSEASVPLIGTLASLTIPAYQSASTACKGDRLNQDGVVSLCQGLARAFENGDSFITQMVGVAIAKRVWPENSPEWQAAVDARQLYEYRTKLWAELPLQTDAGVDRYIALCSQYRREQDVLRAELVDAGKSPDPPKP
jgi:hypothetical protein